MKSVKHRKPYNRLRLCIVVGFLGASFLLILGRLYIVQVARHTTLQAQATRQYTFPVTLRPERGRILDRRGRVLATSVVMPSIYAHPREIDAPDTVAIQLARVLQRPVAEVREKLAGQAAFVWLERQVAPETVAQLQALKLPGVYFRHEPHRYYPKQHLAGQVLGFVNIDENGIEGLEYYYNRALAGQPRQIMLQRDAKRRSVGFLAGEAAEHPRGADIYLTLDERLQHVAERELAAQIQLTQAKSGLVLMMQPHTGEILALASYPFFDPNAFRDPQQQAWRRNRAVTDPVEPGSTFKLIVAAASLEEETVRMDEVFFCENGQMIQGGRRMRDHDPYGFLRFPEVIEHSSNICTVKISERLSPLTLYHYIRRFGFGEKSLVDFAGEDAGQLRDPQQWSRFSHASLAIGQEISVTPLQLLTAYAAVANGGWLMRPRIVSRIVDADTEKHFTPEVRQQILSPQTVKKLTAIFTGVVERGTGKPAAVEGYAVAGKTGTAQKLDRQRGGYSDREVLASFVGYVPAEEPQLVLLVIIDEPKKLRWGSQAAAPVFRRVAQQALHYLQIPPRRARAFTMGVSAEPSWTTVQDDRSSRNTTLPGVTTITGGRLVKIRE
jgi:cell division protein FtsI (penicillin-binding protein 3)